MQLTLAICSPTDLIDRLGDFLKDCKGGRAMNLEELDRFFAALIAGQETVMPSEYYPEVFGGEMSARPAEVRQR
jgi:yecA family protein